MPTEPDAPPSCPNCGRQMRVVEECLHCAMSSALEAVKQAPEPMECGDDEDGFASFAEPKLPARLGRFVLHSRLGHGGMGTVYEAEDVELQRVVALKMIRSQRFAGLAERQRFKREALATAKLDHPHIVPVYEAGELDECPFLAMKLIRGSTLADLVRHGPIPAEKAVRIMAKVAAALQHAHDCGVLHRDLKPSNILIDEQGEPWLTDFGLARLQTGGAHETLHGAQIGTPMYMAPEQAEGRSEEVGPATDVWALGLLLFQMLSGKTPYEMSDNLAVIQQVITKPPPRYLAPTLDQRGLAALIERCLQKDPAQRLASAGLLADELQRWGRGEALLTYPVTPLERGLRGLRRHPAVAAALGIALAVLVGWWLLPPAADYVITTREGVVTITSRGAENEVLELIASSENGTLRALAEGRRFRVDGVTHEGGSVELPLAGVRQWVIETGRAKDRVKFRGKLLLEKDASLELRTESANAGYCSVYIDQRAELRASGTGSISIAASAGIEMDTGAVLEVENGPLHLAGNWPPVPAKTSFHGVLIKGANVQSIGTGAVTLQGHGGSKSANMGVGILGGRVSGGKPGATVRVEGWGGSARRGQAGVSAAAKSQITSLGADVVVTGLGNGNETGMKCFGVDVRTLSEITAGGQGKVHVEGIAGPGIGGQHIGVNVNSGGRISSSGGAVSVSGTARVSGLGVGVWLSEGSIRAGASGSVTITGTGARGEGENELAYGVVLREKPGTLITTAGGPISITGKGGSAEAADIFVATGAQISTLEHGGKITLNGGRQSIALGSVKEGTVVGEGRKPDWIISRIEGVLRVQDYTDLGGVIVLKEAAAGQIELILAPEAVVQMPDSSRLAGGTAPLSLTGIDQLHFQLGDGDDRLEFHGFSGDAFPSVSVDAGPGDDLVQFRGRLSLADGQSVNLDLQDDGPEPGANSVVIMPGANIITRGKGTITMRASRKILLTEATLRTMDGDITLEANQQAQPSTGNFRGVDLIGCQLVSEGTGAITISGRGGNEGDFQFGIRIDKSSVIQGGSSGLVSLKGTGGDNGLNDNSGISLQDENCQILSRGADIELHGTGMGKPGSGYNYGLALVKGRIAAEKAGKVTLTGHGGATLGWSNVGVLVLGALVASENGAVIVTGHGGGSKGGEGGACDGVLVHAKGSIGSTGSGSVTVEGTGGAGAGEQHRGVAVFSEGQIFSSGGTVKITGTASHGGVGVLLSGGSVQSGGKGGVNLQGNGMQGYTADGDASGIALADVEGTHITTAGGAIQLTGIGGNPEAAAITTKSAARISTGGQGGKVTLIGTKLELSAGTVDKDAEFRSDP